MPNYCYGEILIKGHKDSVDEFVKIMQADYDYYTMEFSHKPHMYRVFSADYNYENKLEGLMKEVCLSFECAWSAYVCMFNGPGSYYYHDSKELIYGTHVQEQAKRLQLEIEIYSEEPGVGFQEHYLVDNFGNIIINDEKDDYQEIYIEEYKDYNDYLEDYEDYNPISEEEFNTVKNSGDEYYRSGGFENWDFEMDNRKELCKVILAKVVK